MTDDELDSLAAPLLPPDPFPHTDFNGNPWPASPPQPTRWLPQAVALYDALWRANEYAIEVTRYEDGVWHVDIGPRDGHGTIILKGQGHAMRLERALTEAAVQAAS